MTTKLLYLDDTRRCEADARVLRVLPAGDGRHVVILDATVFYPQGGGQPTDRGKITTPGGTLNVQRASIVDGDVHHAGMVYEGSIEPGDPAHLVIDAELRKTHEQLHTGGHLVMTAVDRLVGYYPIKSYHFPDNPYVEFDGAFPAERRGNLVTELHEAVDSMVTGDSEVIIRYAYTADLHADGIYVPARIPAGNLTRVVVTAGYQSPCRGTHVQRLGELSGLRISALEVKYGRTRVSYLVN
jgi:Ser-tRNA(Ala) deacylase AlaX